MDVTMTVSEARAALPDVLDRVLAGEEVTITRHGRPVAVIVRPDRLRARRATEALRVAGELGQALADARTAPLAPPALTKERANELVREVRAGRARR